MPDDPGERRWRAEFYPPLVSERREVITSGNPKVIFSVIGGDPGRRRNEQGRKMADLNGKVVLVTGSSRGIGAEIAMAFARHGANVVLHGRDTEALAKVQADITNRGGHAMFVTGDVTKFADIEAICARRADLRSGRRVGCLRRRQRQPPRPDRGHQRGDLAS